jgi:hypothetical protein
MMNPLSRLRQRATHATAVGLVGAVVVAGMSLVGTAAPAAAAPATLPPCASSHLHVSVRTPAKHYRPHREIRFEITVRYTGHKDCQPQGCFATVAVFTSHGTEVWDSLPFGADECILLPTRLHPGEVMRSTALWNQRRGNPPVCSIAAHGCPYVHPGRYVAIASYSSGVSRRYTFRIGPTSRLVVRAHSG